MKTSFPYGVMWKYTKHAAQTMHRRGHHQNKHENSWKEYCFAIGCLCPLPCLHPWECMCTWPYHNIQPTLPTLFILGMVQAKLTTVCVSRIWSNYSVICDHAWDGWVNLWTRLRHSLEQNNIPFIWHELSHLFWWWPLKTMHSLCCLLCYPGCVTTSHHMGN